jgi:hypothetical protein
MAEMPAVPAAALAKKSGNRGVQSGMVEAEDAADATANGGGAHQTPTRVARAGVNRSGGERFRRSQSAATAG